jgi:hypothetical protein
METVLKTVNVAILTSYIKWCFSQHSPFLKEGRKDILLWDVLLAKTTTDEMETFVMLSSTTGLRAKASDEMEAFLKTCKLSTRSSYQRGFSRIECLSSEVSKDVYSCEVFSSARGCRPTRSWKLSTGESRFCDYRHSKNYESGQNDFLPLQLTCQVYCCLHMI